MILTYKKKQIREIGYQFGWGLIQAAAVFFTFALVCTIATHRKDDTDSSWGKPSGLKLYTDHGTGVQYLRSKGGGLTPRLDAEGNIVTVK